MPDTVRRFDIGDFRCTAIADTDQGARNVLLVEGSHRVLIDTGAGQRDPGKPGRLRVRLAELGTDPASIDHVVLSHADFDHIGGVTHDDVLTFSHAQHRIRRAEVDFWNLHPIRLKPSPLYDEAFRLRVNSVPPLALDMLGDRLQLVDEPAAEVTSGVTMIAAPGHTPGNAIVRIESRGCEMLFVADLFYQPENIAARGWVSQYDYDPALVVETRARLLDEAATSGTLLMAYHMPFPGLGRVRRTGSGWEWSAAPVGAGN